MKKHIGLTAADFVYMINNYNVTWLTELVIIKQ